MSARTEEGHGFQMGENLGTGAHRSARSCNLEFPGVTLGKVSAALTRRPPDSELLRVGTGTMTHFFKSEGSKCCVMCRQLGMCDF